ncbi:MAG: alkaline phosphatase D family protein [Bacteroidota bacterium]
MKQFFTVLLVLVAVISMTAQNIYQNNRLNGENESFIAEWAPFYHGVASGDPLEDRVIIWTRVTPEEMDGQSIDVDWVVSTDVMLQNIVQSGTFTTDTARDYTVKVDVTGLDAGTTYYYGFSAMGKNSLTGRTKTTPSGDQADHLKFAIVSCSNYPAGYFNAYQRIAERNDLDAVIHLGDYIYEYANFVYGADSSLASQRLVEPNKEIITAADYRSRYSTYRLDTNLIRVHQQHPFITVWDDHESANDAYKDGAENHTPETEGDWETRKAISKDVYFEWMPIRDNEAQSVYRKISYGNITDLIMLDTRLEGREIQIFNALDSALQDSMRTLLGAEQKQWLFDQLSNSTAKWKIIGQQVIFSELNVGWAALQDPTTDYFGTESIFLDIWDGYPAERRQVINFLKDNEIDNTIILTGDFHTTFAFDVADTPVNVTFQQSPLGEVPVYVPSDYDPATGANSVAVEFACPSVNSANFDENTGLEVAIAFQETINNEIFALPGVSLGNPNPHLKYTDFIQHGYFVLDVRQDTAQADYFFTPILEISNEETFGRGLYTQADSNHLIFADTFAAPKAVQDEPAPLSPPLSTNVEDIATPNVFALLANYPNPFGVTNTLHYSLSESAQVSIRLYDVDGKLVDTLIEERLPTGIYTTQLNAANLTNGTYIYRIDVNDRTYNTKVVVAK